MAQVLEEFEFTGRAGRALYPWHEWLDGRIWELHQGVDFEPEIKSFSSTVINAAKSRGKKVKTGKIGDKVFVIQAYIDGTPAQT